MEKEQIEQKSIYLDDYDVIEWERPSRIQRPDRICMPGLMKPNASNELISYIGFDILNEIIGQYHLTASAAKYDAKIALRGEKPWLFEVNEQTTNKPENMILFAGNIAIYSTGKIPGTDIKGHDFIKHGGIFTARKSTKALRSNQGLKNLIFENADENDSARIIEAIIRGYENQELAKENAQSKAVHSAYKSGDADRAEEAYGTFGRHF